MNQTTKETLLENSLQVAGVIDFEEAEMLIDCGIKNIGFPLRLDYHKEDLSDEEAAGIVREFGDRVNFFVITYLQNASEIMELCRKIGVSIVQIHGEITSGELKALRKSAPDLIIIKSLIVRGDNLPDLKEEVASTQEYVNAYITDTYDPDTGAKGATGKRHDWDISRQLVQSVPHPLILAGGLNPENVRRAILDVKPSGVDVHTGIEGKDGRKKRELVEAFLREAESAFRVLEGSV
jgi:phosphoribosylanthranilate isomerase